MTAPGVLAGLRPLLLCELTAQRISDWLAVEIQSRPTVTGLANRMLRAFIRWAAEVPEYAGLIPIDAYSARSVRNLVPKVNVRHGDSLQREQLKAWFSGVRSMHNRMQSIYLQGLLIKGARREELAAVRWTDVDLQWRGLSISIGRCPTRCPRRRQSPRARLPVRVATGKLCFHGRLVSSEFPRFEPVSVAGLVMDERKSAQT